MLELDKNIFNWNFQYYIWIQYKKSLQMSTNKPSIGLGILEIYPLQFQETKL